MVEATAIFGDHPSAFGEGNPFTGDVLANLPAEQQERLDELSGAGPRRRDREFKELRTKYPIDALTGLNLFHNDLTQRDIKGRLEEAARHGHETWVVMFDLDHFKAVNDEFGHMAGDEVLKITADALKKGVRESDTVARIGGDEFVFVLPDIESVDQVGDARNRHRDVVLDRQAFDLLRFGHVLAQRPERARLRLALRERNVGGEVLCKVF